MLSPSSTASSGSQNTSGQQRPKSQNVALRTKKQVKVKVEDDAESVKSDETALTTTSKSSTAVRKRRTHRKSRLGCTNCKMRSVKCDESKPSCGRCVSSGFTCTYSTIAPALEVAYSGVFQVDLSLSSRGTPPLISNVIPLMKSEGGGVTTYQMRPYEVAAIDRYLHRTVNTFLVKRDNDKEKAVDIANSNPFLFHIFTGFALLHDVHISADPVSVLKANSKAMAFHWCQTASLFKQRLEEYVLNPGRSVDTSDRDALWMCSALMTCGIFANIDTFDPLRSYPIKPSDPQDFSWVKIDRGVHIVWALTDPTRPDSHYYDFYKFMESCNMPDCRAPIRQQGIPTAFNSLFELDSDSNVDNNPYYGPVSVLSQVQDDEFASFRASLRHFGFISQIRPEFLEKLEIKDPRALLILAVWYSKMSGFNWWFCKPRSLVEGVSICLYLERYHADETVIMELLQEPRRVIFNKFDSMPWNSKTQAHEERMRSLGPLTGLSNTVTSVHA